jgi:hypothetical protein
MMRVPWHSVAVEGLRARLRWLERVKVGTVLLPARAPQEMVALGAGRFMLWHRDGVDGEGRLPRVYVVNCDSTYIGEILLDDRAWPMRMCDGRDGERDISSTVAAPRA